MKKASILISLLLCLLMAGCRYAVISTKGCHGCNWRIERHQLIRLSELAPAQAVEFPATDDVPLTGFVTNRHQRNRLLIFVPGKHGSIRFARYRPHYEAFLRLGYDVFAVNPRGYGSSDGPVNLMEMGQDVAGAIRYARKRYPDAELALYGTGIGTAAITAYVAGKPVGEASGQLPDCLPIVLESPVLSWHELLARMPAKNSKDLQLADSLHFNSRQQFERIRCPTLWFYGGADRQSIPPMVQAYFQAMPAEEKSLVRDPVAGHADWPISAPARFDSSLQAFLPSR